VSPTEECRPSRPFRLTSVILKMCDHMNINCICVSVKCENVVIVGIRYCTCIVLAVMCMCVIYTCLSRDSSQLRDLGKPSQAAVGKLLSIQSHMVRKKTQLL
jgi:hypothetical protein